MLDLYFKIKQDVFLVAELGLFFYFLFWIWKRWKLTKIIDKIPGPKALPLLGNITQIGILSSVRKSIDPLVVLLQHRQGLCLLYSQHKIMRIWIGRLPLVVFHKPEAIEAVLGSSVLIDKGISYDFVSPWLGKGLLTNSGSSWKQRRRLLTPAFHFRILQDFQLLMNDNAKILVHKLRSACHDVFDVVPFLTMCTLDIICETAMGVSIKAQEENSSSYVMALKEVSAIVTERIFNPWLASNFIFSLTSQGRRFRKSLKVLHSFTRKVIHERMKCMIENGKKVNDSESKRRVPFLELLLQLHLDGEQISLEEIREEVDTFMFEGHDTTAYGLAWAIYLLGLHPDIQNRLRKELLSIFNGDRDKEITNKDLVEMKYLECVIKESQRIFPSVPHISRKLSEDIVIDGYTVPKGTNCQLFHYQLHRNAEIFPEPEVFDPDRFLPQNVSMRHPYAYVPFSAGPRNCIGQKFAMNEEKTVLAEILRNFKITSVDQRDKLLYTSQLILKPIPGIRIRLEPI